MVGGTEAEITKLGKWEAGHKNDVLSLDSSWCNLDTRFQVGQISNTEGHDYIGGTTLLCIRLAWHWWWIGVTIIDG